MGPTKDAYTIGDNQQYQLSVGAGRGSVWVLLSRHITNIDDFRDNKEYITLLVYQNNGKRVYYPCSYIYYIDIESRFLNDLSFIAILSDDPEPFIDGVRINSPHYLCKIKLDPNAGKK